MPLWINVANALTLLRLLLAPFVIQAILDGRHTLALALFAVAAFTDLLDGALARRLRLSTQTGAYLDPIADKCLLSGVFVALAAAHTVPWWLVILIFARDLYILCGVMILMIWKRIRKFPPSVWGKVATFFQIVTVVVWMVRNMLAYSWLDFISTVVLWPCAIFTLWSGVHYTWRSIRILRAH